MKTTYKNHFELSHAFYHQQSEYGKTSGMNFNKNWLYSYGEHFPIAIRVAPGKYLFTKNSYSVSTSKHISRASAACNGEKIYCYLERLDKDIFHEKSGNKFEFHTSTFIEKQIKGFSSDAKALENKIIRARKPEFYIEQYERLKTEYEALLETFIGTKEIYKPLKKELNKIFVLDTSASDFTELKAKALETTKAAQDKIAKIELKTIKEWKQGVKQYVSAHNQGKINTWLRLHTTNQMLTASGDSIGGAEAGGNLIIQTSKGVSFSIGEAVKAYEQVKAGTLKGIRTINGACYMVETITKDYLKAGCHCISIKDIESIYKQIKAAGLIESKKLV